MKIRVRKEEGFWKTYFVYNQATDNEYEVFMDKYTDHEEAIAVAFFVAGLED